MNFLAQLRNATLLLLSGAIMGGYEVHQIETVPLINKVVAGACGEPGIQTVSVSLIKWYDCQTPAIARAIQAQDALNDTRNLEGDPIGDIIRASEKKGKRK